MRPELDRSFESIAQGVCTHPSGLTIRL